MGQYLSDDRLLLDEGDNPHLAFTFGTYEGVCFIYFLDQTRPVYIMELGKCVPVIQLLPEFVYNILIILA